MSVETARFRYRPLTSAALPVAVLALLGLAACGRSPAPATEGAAGTAAPARAAAAAPADADLVAAVALGSGAQPASLRFQILERPALGQVFQVRVQLAASTDLDKVQVSVTPSSGLELTEAAPIFDLAHAAAGENHEHTFGVRATADGVLELRASVVAVGAQGPVSSDFSIPVIVAKAP